MGIFCKVCNKEIKIEQLHFINGHVRKEHKLSSKEYFDKYLKTEHDGKCRICNKDTKYFDLITGYSKTCSKQCKYQYIKQRVTSTNIEKYGVEYPLQNKKIFKKTQESCLNNIGVDNPFKDKNIQNNIKNTNMEKYGVMYPTLNKDIKSKVDKTNLERYGTIYPIQNTDVQQKSKKSKYDKYGDEYYNNIEKIKNTNMEKYGFDFPMKNKDVQQRSIINAKKRIDKKYKKLGDMYDLEYISFENSTITYLCKKHNKKFNIQTQLINLRMKKNENICLLCNIVKNSSFDEKHVYEFIKENYNDVIITNDRKVLDGNELDIYLPDLKLAFEFNGVYWHNELYKDKNYHLNKTEKCLKKGIQLIHIYEDDWKYKRDIVKSRILNLLGKSARIYARKCIIKYVDVNTYKNFLEENHIQGSVNSKYTIGLYCKDELMSLMTFGGSRFEKNKIEMLRFCNKLNVSVIGGSSRLFKYFIRNNNDVHEVISYADRSWSIGGLYETLGFKLIKETKPNYHYIVNKIRENRFKYRKSELIKQGHDKEKTEREIMFDRGIYRIYDSGNLKYMYSV